jgi:hypothetical protein
LPGTDQDGDRSVHGAFIDGDARKGIAILVEEEERAVLDLRFGHREPRVCRCREGEDPGTREINATPTDDWRGHPFALLPAF